MNKFDSQQISSEMKTSSVFVIITLALLSAFGPFVTDLYLPALPLLTGYFNTTASSVQLSLSLSMMGLAVGQLLIGPISDTYGRKKPLLFCMLDSYEALVSNKQKALLSCGLNDEARQWVEGELGDGVVGRVFGYDLLVGPGAAVVVAVQDCGAVGFRLDELSQGIKLCGAHVTT